MKTIPLPPETRAYMLATHKIILTHEDVAAVGAAASGSIELMTVPAGTTVRFAGFNLVTAFDFSDAGITSLLQELGDSTDPNRFLLSTQIAEDGTQVLYQDANAATQPYTYEAEDTIDLLLTAANGGSPLLSECNVGEIEYYLHITNKEALERAQ